MARKEERRYTPEELAEHYQGSKIRYSDPQSIVKLKTIIKTSIRRAVNNYVDDLWNDQMEHSGKGKPTRPRDMEQVEQDCYVDGDCRDVSLKSSYVEALIRDGYLIPRSTPQEKQWQKRRDAYLAEQDAEKSSESGTNQGHGGRA